MERLPFRILNIPTHPPPTPPRLFLLPSLLGFELRRMSESELMWRRCSTRTCEKYSYFLDKAESLSFTSTLELRRDTRSDCVCRCADDTVTAGNI